MQPYKVQRVRLAIPINLFSQNKVDIEIGKGKQAKVTAQINPPFIAFTHADREGQQILVPLDHVKSIIVQAVGEAEVPAVTLAPREAPPEPVEAQPGPGPDYGPREIEEEKPRIIKRRRSSKKRR